MSFSIIDKHVPTGQGRAIVVTNERKMSKRVRASPLGEGGSASSVCFISLNGARPTGLTALLSTHPTGP